MVGFLIAVLLAALTFALCTALELPAALGILLAVIVFAASVPTLGTRFGVRDL